MRATAGYIFLENLRYSKKSQYRIKSLFFPSKNLSKKEFKENHHFEEISRKVKKSIQ